MVSALICARRRLVDEKYTSGPFLFNRIKRRIQEMREQNLTSWELAVAAMPKLRGWLAAFATAAILLIAISSIQWQQPVLTSDPDQEPDELNIQSPAEYLISDIPNSTSEEDPYALK
jgi:hypothetical protein